MATYFFNDKDKVETTMYRQVLEDAKKDLNNKLSIEMDLYPKAIQYKHGSILFGSSFLV